MRITLKKAGVAASAGVMALTGLLSTAGPAQAAGPMGAHNIRGIDPGNPDWLIHLFCDQGRADDIHFGAYNVKTGEFRKEKDYIGKISRNRAPRGDWEVFAGRCYYPQASTWTYTGKEERISQWIANRGRTDDKETFVRGYSSKTSATKSIGGSLDFGLAKSIFTGKLGGNFSYQWGWEETRSFERRSEKSIPPCTQIAVTWKPYKRVVRVNPVIEIGSYAWERNGRITQVGTWRGRDASYKRIYSYGYYIDGVSDQLIKTWNGTKEPDGVESKIEQRLNPSQCSR
ncbi:hypothetical protein [Streptomyces sp. T028]|uniref:hypothetical protein n=1 Tax=Streptomyces sp. T028 TaxID=3394379 RepID=UPI003A88CACD